MPCKPTGNAMSMVSPTPPHHGWVGHITIINIDSCITRVFAQHLFLGEGGDPKWQLSKTVPTWYLLNYDVGGGYQGCNYQRQSPHDTSLIMMWVGVTRGFVTQLCPTAMHGYRPRTQVSGTGAWEVEHRLQFPLPITFVSGNHNQPPKPLCLWSEMGDFVGIDPIRLLEPNFKVPMAIVCRMDVPGSCPWMGHGAPWHGHGLVSSGGGGNGSFKLTPALFNDMPCPAPHAWSLAINNCGVGIYQRD